MLIDVPVTWEMCGRVRIEADSLADAVKEFHRVEDRPELPTDGDYVDGSFVITTDELEILQIFNPGVPVGDTKREGN